MTFINLDFIWNLGTTNILSILTIFSFTNGLVLFPASQAILIFGGLLMGKSNLSFLFIFVSLVLSNFVGNYLLYFIAFNWGEETARKILPVRKKTLDKHLKIVHYLFEKHGPLIIFVGRNLPVLHSLVSIPAGVAKVPKKTFTIYTILGIMVWSLIFMGIGIYFGNNYEAFVRQFEMITLMISVVLLGGTYCFCKMYLDKIFVLAENKKY